MGVKVKIETVRDCCHPDDLKRYQGGELPGFDANGVKNTRLSFCTHCGQLWYWTRRAGEMDAGWERVGPEDLK